MRGPRTLLPVARRLDWLVRCNFRLPHRHGSPLARFRLIPRAARHAQAPHRPQVPRMRAQRRPQRRLRGVADPVSCAVALHDRRDVRVVRVLLPRTPAFSFSGGCRGSRDASPWCQRGEQVGGVRAARASISRCAAASSPNNKARTPGRTDRQSHAPANRRFPLLERDLADTFTGLRVGGRPYMHESPSDWRDVRARAG